MTSRTKLSLTILRIIASKKQLLIIPKEKNILNTLKMTSKNGNNTISYILKMQVKKIPSKVSIFLVTSETIY